MRTSNIAQTARAQSLRRDMTDAERKLWSRLRNRKFGGVKFVRQFPVGPYFADLCCREHMLIIEADGWRHNGSARDEHRDAFLVLQGYRILRLWNADILNDWDMVSAMISAALDGRLEAGERFKTPV